MDKLVCAYCGQEKEEITFMIGAKLNDHSDYIEFAQKKFNEGYDYVLMGHRHNPFVHEEHGKKYFNLGDWLVNYSYAVFDGKELKLNILNDHKTQR